MARVMKDSSIEWIGEIPAGWEVRKLKHYYEIQTGFTPDTKKEEFYDDENGFDWVNISDIQDGEIIFNTKKKVSQLFVDQYKPTIIPKGSLLYSFKLSVGQTAFTGKDMYSNEAIAAFLPVKGANLRFLRYSSSLIIENAEVNIYNARILNRDRINNAYIVFPPEAEQNRIADYLDAKCARIDAVIEQTRASIEEYKKLKQSVITQAVTKGIRPGRKMKDSGVEWIGEMPEEWAIIAFRHVLKERVEKNIPVKSTERLSLSIDLGVTLYSEKTTNLDRFKDDFEQYKIAHVGDLVMNSMNMIVGATGVSDYYGCISPAYYTFFDDAPDHITAKYCEYIFRSKTMLRVLFSLGKGIYAIVRGDDRVNTCRLKVSREDLRQIEIPLPNVEEQREIVQYLCKKTQEIDDLIKHKNEIISELESYKKSLIFEYVTGKKEVPV